MPVDKLEYLASPVLGSLTFAPLVTANLLLQARLPPCYDTMVAAYRPLWGSTRQLLWAEWKRLDPLPAYHTLPLSLTTPHPFISLGKFMAGPIRQMRAQNSSLRPHPSWS